MFQYQSKILRSSEKLRIYFLLIVLLFFTAIKINAQSVKHFFIETDPSTFAFQGYAIHFRFIPSDANNLVMGIGTYSMKFPGLIVNLNSMNRNAGWNVKLNHGYGIFGDYYFKKAGKGIFAGVQLALQEYKITNSDQTASEQTFDNILIMPRLGYQWYPFEKGLYIMPWIGLGYETKVGGSNNVGDKSYDISPVLPFATFHIGYNF